MKTVRCVLKKGKEKPLLGRHPWVFSGAIDQIEDTFEPGDYVRVFSSDERFLGIGYGNPQSQITIRMLAFEDIPIDAAFFEQKIQDAVRLRREIFSDESRTNAYRLIHAEGDFLPGLIVDRYGEFLVVQCLTLGMEMRKSMIVGGLRKIFPAQSIFERSDSDLREREGLSRHTGVLAGEKPSERIEITENGLHFYVDVFRGQKTGFFLDQRENRSLAASLARGRSVLNCFSYTGAFSVYAARAGAREVISVESSEAALRMAKTNADLNHIQNASWVKGDVFDYLREGSRSFDFVILDPPAFCKTHHQIQQAARGYKDINLSAMKRLSKQGLLLTSSCSSHISPDLFQKIIFGAAKDAGRQVRILAKTGHAMDHPVNICHPEGEYLKSILCEVA